MLTRSRYYVMMSRALSAYASWQLDRQDRHIEELVKVGAWFQTGVSQHTVSVCYGWLADVMSRSGHVAETRLYASAAFQRARKGDRLGEALASRSLARLAATGMGSRPPSHYLQRAYRCADARLSPRETAETRLCEAEIALSRGDAEGAAKLAQLAKAEFAKFGMDWHLTQAETVLVKVSTR